MARKRTTGISLPQSTWEKLTDYSEKVKRTRSQVIEFAVEAYIKAVSYTHLTLPTICSV